MMTGDIQSESEHARKMFSPRKILILFFLLFWLLRSDFLRQLVRV